MSVITITAIIAFLIAVLMGPKLIPFLLKLKIGQTEREDGPQSHLKKSGTPTMGGIMILTAFLIPALVMVNKYELVAPVVFLTLGMGFVGFVDDYIKVVKKRSLGLRAWQKMAMQIIIAIVFGLYLELGTDISLAMKVPFLQDKMIDFGFFNIPVLVFVVIATANGTNLTDGVDGLLSSTTLGVTGFFLVLALTRTTGLEPAIGAMIGALMGFLCYNSYPAKVFMGDTGSLALGGFVAAMAYVLEMPLFIPIIGIIYLIEAVSVMLQVGYFKLSHGKRIFKMAPIHHHFELSGWSETRTVAIFTIITILFCMVAYLGV